MCWLPLPPSLPPDAPPHPTWWCLAAAAPAAPATAIAAVPTTTRAACAHQGRFLCTARREGTTGTSGSPCGLEGFLATAGRGDGSRHINSNNSSNSRHSSNSTGQDRTTCSQADPACGRATQGQPCGCAALLLRQANRSQCTNSHAPPSHQQHARHSGQQPPSLSARWLQ